MTENIAVAYLNGLVVTRLDTISRETCRLATHLANQLEELEAPETVEIQVSSLIMEEREYERCLAFLQECQAFFARQKAEDAVAFTRNRHERLRRESWVARHIPGDYPAHFALLEAAHKIGCEALVDILAGAIAKACIGKTAPEIRAHFRIDVG